MMYHAWCKSKLSSFLQAYTRGSDDWYHGTSSFKNAQRITRDGLHPNVENNYLSYITQDLRQAWDFATKADEGYILVFRDSDIRNPKRTSMIGYSITEIVYPVELWKTDLDSLPYGIEGEKFKGDFFNIAELLWSVG